MNFFQRNLQHNLRHFLKCDRIQLGKRYVWLLIAHVACENVFFLLHAAKIDLHLQLLPCFYYPICYHTEYLHTHSIKVLSSIKMHAECISLQNMLSISFLSTSRVSAAGGNLVQEWPEISPSSAVTGLSSAATDLSSAVYMTQFREIVFPWGIAHLMWIMIIELCGADQKRSR